MTQMEKDILVGIAKMSLDLLLMGLAQICLSQNNIYLYLNLDGEDVEHIIISLIYTNLVVNVILSN